MKWQNDNKSPAKKTISHWTGSNPLPLQQIFTPLLVKGKIGGLSLAYSLVWMKCDYLFRMLSCTVRGANEECYDKCSKKKSEQGIILKLVMPITTCVLLL